MDTLNKNDIKRNRFDEAAIIAAAKTGDNCAFEYLVEKYYGIAYAIAFSRIGNHESAEDIAQEAFVRAYLYMHSFQEQYKFINWIVRIVHNLANTWKRHEQRSSKIISIIENEKTLEGTPISDIFDVREKMNREELNNTIINSIFNLPEDQREILMLHYLEGLNQKEIAEYLEVHPSTVGRQMQKALSMLKDSLEPAIHESIQTMKAPQKSIAKTMILISALSVMSMTGKSSIVEAAGGSTWITSVAVLSVAGTEAGASAQASVGLSASGFFSGIFSLIKLVPGLMVSGWKMAFTVKGMASLVAAASITTAGALYYPALSANQPQSAVVSAAAVNMTPSPTPSQTPSPALTAAPTPMPPAVMKTLHFPADHSFGNIKIRENKPIPFYEIDWNWYPPLWKYYANAQGDVQVPADMLIKLEVSAKTYDDLSPLLNLKPDDIYELDMGGFYKGMGDKQLSFISNLTGLINLEIPGDKNTFTSKGVENLKLLKSLRKLTINGDKLDNKCFEIIGSIQSLEIFDVWGKKFNDEGLKHLQNLSNLKEVRICSEFINGSGLSFVKSLPSLEYLTLSVAKNFNENNLQLLQGSKSLKKINIVGFKELRITKIGIQQLAGIPNLEDLKFTWINSFSDPDMTYFTKFPSLKSLEVPHINMTDAGLCTINEMKSLERLWLPNLGLSDKSLEYISELPNLKFLSIGNSTNTLISDSGLKLLEKCTKLEDLSIAGKNITDDGMDSLARLSNLKKLSLFSVPLVTDKGMAKLSALKQLKELCMFFTDCSIATLNSLNGSADMELLDIMDLRKEDTPLNISGFSNLWKLRITYSKENSIEDEDLACLANMKKLGWLDLSTNFSDKGMIHLSGLTNLWRLNVGGPDLTDKGLEHISNLTKLEELGISGNITDAGLKYLENMKGLYFLRINTSAKISDEAINRFKSKMPNLFNVDLNNNRVFKQSTKNENTVKDPAAPDYTLSPVSMAGKPAPDFEAETFDGKKIKLSDFKGKVVMLDFWATWCKPCTSSTPQLLEFYKKQESNKDFVMIGLSLDDSEQVLRNYIQDNNIPWINLRIGTASKIGDDYRVKGVPAYFLIGKDGNMILDKDDKCDNVSEVIAKALKQ